jgi:hypothetical protein
MTNELNETPLWALEKAAKAAGYSSYWAAHCILSAKLKTSIVAHAATLAKYETEPVDPVLAKARELLAAEFIKDDHSRLADDIICGDWDEETDIRAIKAALRLPAMGKSDAR